MLRIDWTRIRFAFMAVFFTAFLIYLTLLCGEIALAYITRPTGAELERLESLRERIEKQDIQLRKEALRDGFKPVITPGNIESSSTLKSLALRYNVAPVAPQPRSNLNLCNEGYGLVRYTSDRFGFRNPDDVWQDSADVILIGDSYVHGACVEDADTIAGHLKRRFRVLNLGTIGNNPVTYASIAKTFLPKVKTRFVVLVFYSNDFNSGSVFSYNYLGNFLNSPNYFKEKGGKLQLSEELKSFYKDAEKIVISEVMRDLEGEDLKKRFSLTHRYLSGKRFELRLLTEQITELYRKLFPNSSMPFSTKLAIDTTVDACRQHSCTPVIAFIPPSDKWNPDRNALLYSELLSDYAKRKGLKFLDATKALRVLGESAYAREGGHLSPQGYKAFADELAKGLEQS